MAGQVYELPVWETITEAWNKTVGAKGSFWASLAILFVIMFLVGVLQGLLEESKVAATIVSLIGNIIGFFLELGLIYMGISRAKGNEINFKMIFYAFNLQLALSFIGVYILLMLIYMIPVAIGGLGVFLFALHNVLTMIVGVLLCIAAFVSFLYIAIRLALSMAFILDTGAAPVQALKASYAATNGNIINLLGIFLLQLLIITISVIPLGIGLIWSLPFSFICFGLIYQRLRNNV